MQGQVPVSQYELPYDGLLEQEYLNPPLSQIGGRASNEPEASNGPEAKSLQFGSLPSQESQESALDNRSTRKTEAEETLIGPLAQFGPH